VLYGMGFRPHDAQGSRRAAPADQADDHFREAARLARKMLPALPSNRELIEHIQQHGLMRI
jgi:hypothetical protein